MTMTFVLQTKTDANRERGFTLVELLVATVVSMLVLGGAVALTSQIQTGYRRQVEAAAAEQEGRYALEWIGKLLRSAGNNPFPAKTVLGTNCPGAPDPSPLTFKAIRFDPDIDGEDNDIRLQTDANPPDGIIGGVAPPNCDQANEDVTISYDAANRAIVFYDNNLAPEASIRTDAVIDGLHFISRNSAHQTEDPPGTPITEGNVRYVETRITVRTRTIDPATGQPVTRTISSEVRVRGIGVRCR
jgi:type II secretory pathway pseudopilin PulG